MLPEEFQEGGNWNVKCVVAVVLVYPGELRRGSDAPRFLEDLKCGLWDGVDGIGKRLEGVLLGIVEESPLLKEEGDILLASSLQCALATLSSAGR